MDIPSLRTLVLNTDALPLKIIDWKKAITLVYVKKSVHLLDFYANYKIYDGRKKAYNLPAVLILKRHVKRKYKVACNRRNILARDNNQCMYCGEFFPSNLLSIDHVYPTSKYRLLHDGSSTVWSNVVCACKRCNTRKGSKTCEEAGMFPLRAPYTPSYTELMLGITKNSIIPQEWVPYFTFKNSKGV